MLRPEPPDTAPTLRWSAVAVWTTPVPAATRAAVPMPETVVPATFGARAIHGVGWFMDGGVGCCTSARYAPLGLPSQATPTRKADSTALRATNSSLAPRGDVARNRGNVSATNGWTTMAQPNSHPAERQLARRTATMA